MRVLVTRPALSGARTAKKLAARGHAALLLPLTSPLHDSAAMQAALASSTGAIAVTSAEAVRGLRTMGSSLAGHFARPLFAVGRATAEKAAEAGFTRVHHSSGDGAELADLIAGRQKMLEDQPLTYLAGLPRASGFEEGLSRHGIRFDSVECYRMEPVEPSATELRHLLGDRPVDAVVFYSRHNAERFFGLGLMDRHAEQFKNTRLLCLSATIATIVPYSLASQVEIASVPEEDSLLRLLDADADPILI